MVLEPIRDLAVSIERLLRSLAQYGDQLEQHRLSDQLIRYNLWARESGVNREDAYSFDQQLRRNTEVQTMVIQLLESMRSNAVLALEALERAGQLSRLGQESNYALSSGSDLPNTIQSEGVRSAQSITAYSIMHTTIGAIRSPDGESGADGRPATQYMLLDAASEPGSDGPISLKDACAGIEHSVTRLVRLSRAISRHQKAQADAVAARFVPQDDASRPLLEDFTTHVEWLLCKHPQLSLKGNAMHDRLKRTMVKRWRISSFHASKAAEKQSAKRSRFYEPGMLLSVQSPADLGFADKDKQNETSGDRPASGQISAASPSNQMQGDSQSRKTLNSGFRPPPDLTSSVSLPRSKSLAGTRAIDFPSAPMPLQGATEILCPYCGSYQPKSILQDNAWRLHVAHDLAPYICLYQDCADGDQLYRTTREWLLHLQSHEVQSWSCRRCLNEFQSPELFREHIQQTHNLTIGKDEMSLLLSLNASPLGLQSCPICEIRGDQVDELNNHIAEHLRQLALLCLPWTVHEQCKSSDRTARKMSHDADSSDIRMEEYVNLHTEDSPAPLSIDLDDNDSPEIRGLDLTGRELPDNWRCYVSSGGLVYYQDEIRDLTFWRRPVTLDPDLETQQTQLHGDQPFKHRTQVAEMSSIQRRFAQTQASYRTIVVRWLTSMLPEDQVTMVAETSLSTLSAGSLERTAFPAGDYSSLDYWDARSTFGQAQPNLQISTWVF